MRLPLPKNFLIFGLKIRKGSRLEAHVLKYHLLVPKLLGVMSYFVNLSSR